MSKSNWVIKQINNSIKATNKEAYDKYFKNDIKSFFAEKWDLNVFLIAFFIIISSYGFFVDKSILCFLNDDFHSVDWFVYDVFENFTAILVGSVALSFVIISNLITTIDKRNDDKSIRAIINYTRLKSSIFYTIFSVFYFTILFVLFPIKGFCPSQLIYWVSLALLILLYQLYLIVWIFLRLMSISTEKGMKLHLERENAIFERRIVQRIVYQEGSLTLINKLLANYNIQKRFTLTDICEVRSKNKPGFICDINLGVLEEELKKINNQNISINTFTYGSKIGKNVPLIFTEAPNIERNVNVFKVKKELFENEDENYNDRFNTTLNLVNEYTIGRSALEVEKQLNNLHDIQNLKFIANEILLTL